MEEAEKVLKTILTYTPSSTEINLILTNLYLSRNNCRQAQKYFTNVYLADTYSKKEFLQSTINYLFSCNPTNSNIDKLRSFYNKHYNEDVPLKRLK